MNSSMRVSGRPKTILHIIDSLEYGGAQRLLSLLAQFTPPESYRMVVAVLQDKNPLAQKFEKTGVNLYLFNRARPSILKPLRFISYVYRNLKDIISICKKEHVDIIHCHLSDAEFLGILAAVILGIRNVFITIHVSRLFPPYSKSDPRLLARKLLMRILYRFTKGIISVSKEVTDEVQNIVKVSKEKIFTLINGIDTKVFESPGDCEYIREELGLNQNTKVLLNVGRLTEAKGQVYLINAMKLLASRYPGIRLLIAGEGELKPFLKELVIRNELERFVIFLGTRDDIPELLSLADVFVFPSVHEGTPLSLLEAMAAGKPIVASDIPPHRDLLVDRHSAILVSPEDSLDLAEAIEKLLMDSKLGVELGMKARETVQKNFDINVMISQLIEIWER